MGLTSTRSELIRSYVDSRIRHWIALNVENLTQYAAACPPGLSALGALQQHHVACGHRLHHIAAARRLRMCTWLVQKATQIP